MKSSKCDSQKIKADVYKKKPWRVMWEHIKLF